MTTGIRRTINVIDMYHGNKISLPNFAALKAAGIFAVVHKASQGLHFEDPLYSARREAAEAAGLLWGAYHFLDNSDPEKQAEFFLKCAGVSNANSEPCLLACDFENSPHQPTLQQCMKFMSEVDQNSPPTVQSVLYSGNLIRETLKPSPGGHQHDVMAGAQAFFQQHRLWLAEYGPAERVPYPWNLPVVKSSNEADPNPAPGVWLWQYTEAGHVNPIIGKTDGNFFDGTFEQLKERWLS